MKKVFMIMAVASFFAMSTTSCAEEADTEEGTENAEGTEEGSEDDHGH